MWANLLSLSRIPLGILLLFCPIPWLRLVICAVAGATDAVDGWVARREGSPSKWGALLDPLGDKVFAGCALVAAYRAGALQWAEISILLSREGALLLYCVGWWLLGHSRATLRLGSVWGSKIFTVLQFVVLGLAMMEWAIPQWVWPALLVLAFVAAIEWMVALGRARSS
ncbi:MAG: CDP-alcohol phosphatidyltransferase family protein [Chlamydiia bacterium]